LLTNTTSLGTIKEVYKPLISMVQLLKPPQPKSDVEELKKFIYL